MRTPSLPVLPNAQADLGMNANATGKCMQKAKRLFGLLVGHASNYDQVAVILSLPASPGSARGQPSSGMNCCVALREGLIAS